jgi:hypothetical protein
MPSRFRKVAPSKPVFPFKTGDRVVCQDARCAPGTYTALTTGRAYRVLRSVSTETSNALSFKVVVVDDRGEVWDYETTRFCAPEEYRDRLVNTVASGLRDRVEAQEQEIARWRREYSRVCGLKASLYSKLQGLQLQRYGLGSAQGGTVDALKERVAELEKKLRQAEGDRDTYRLNAEFARVQVREIVRHINDKYGSGK